ncbi:MAG: response regulator, partial [Myxococcales bacterium]|nr:response regulator [Myxococcales bacterium]
MAPRILLADDDRNFAEILAKALSAAGYEMNVCYDGESAVSMARELAPELVILDVLLPQRDGFSALQAIRADTQIPRQPAALLLTGCSPTPRYRTRSHELSAEALLTKPLPLEEIQVRVAKALGSGPPVPASGSGPSLSGELEKTPLPAVLHQLHGMRASGVLVLENGEEKRGIELSDGQLSSVQSNLRSECLGNLLAAAGKISWDVMHESLRRVKQGEGLQGQILLAMHMLDEEDLARALRQQADEKLFQAFAWSRGTYQFASGSTLKTKNRLRLKRSVANAIMQGVRSRTPFEVIERFFAENGDGYLIPSERPYYRFQEIDLATDEEQLFAELANGLSIPAGLPKDEALLRALYGFVATELVEFRRGEPPAPAVAQTDPPTQTSDRAIASPDREKALMDRRSKGGP